MKRAYCKYLEVLGSSAGEMAEVEISLLMLLPQLKLVDKDWA